MTPAQRPTYFATPAEFRAWLEKNHARAGEVLVGYYKKGSRRPSMTWPESVDEALSYGWIDGVRRSIDGERYTIRFTPRTVRSPWSAVNVRRATVLIRDGRMSPAGRKAFESRKVSGNYSYEQRQAARLEPEDERLFRRDRQAWAFFQASPPSYRQAAIWWVTNAKKPETRKRRLDTLISDSRRGRTVPPLTPRRRSERS